jgi:hypothetical protein
MIGWSTEEVIEIPFFQRVLILVESQSRTSYFHLEEFKMTIGQALLPEFDLEDGEDAQDPGMRARRTV